jgi:AhpD family alkylhydroperoxidase
MRHRVPGGGEECDMASKKEIHTEIREAFGLVPDWVEQLPGPALAGFWGMFRDFYLAETDIPNKYKELIGVAVSGATRCRYCALFHTEAARLYGATDAEIAEASLMGGVSMMASTFVNAQQIDFDDFRRETEAIVSYVRKQTPQPEQGRAARVSA